MGPIPCSLHPLLASAGPHCLQALLQAALPAIRNATGPGFWCIKIKAEDNPIGAMPPKDGVTLKDRFRAALLGST